MLAILFTGEATGQDLRLAQQLTFAGPTAVSMDRLGNFYFADQRRTVYQFSAMGEQIRTYSPAISGTINSIEARNGINILLFYYDQQRIVLLDRFLREISSVDLASLPELGNQDIFRAATFSADNQLWLYNESSFTLSKIDSRTYKPFFSTPLGLLKKQKFDIRFMREYQNNLYLVEKNSGIMLFDNMGNYRKTIPVVGLDYVGFAGDELYYLQEGKLHFYHLYNGQERQLPLNTQQPYKTALVGEGFLYLFTDQGIDIFRVE